MRQGICDNQNNQQKQFEILTPTIPQYYLTQFHSGVQQIQLIAEGLSERPLAGGQILVECQKSYCIYTMSNECQVSCDGRNWLDLADHLQITMSGSLKALFDAQGKIELLDLVTTAHREYIPRSLLQPVPVEVDSTQSPKMTKTTNKRKKQPAAAQEQATTINVPVTKLTQWGIPEAVFTFLEVRAKLTHHSKFSSDLFFSWPRR